MRRTLTLSAVAVVFMLGLPAAFAKGPVGVAISGDGISGPVQANIIEDVSAGRPVASLFEALGGFDLIFGEASKAKAEAPTKALGKRMLTIEWDLHGGDPRITQYLYLDADGGPVAHVPAGQPLWEDMVSAGGWMVVEADIASPLTALGVDAAMFKAAPTKAPVTKAPDSKAPIKESPAEVPAKKAPVEKAPAVEVPATVAPAAVAPAPSAPEPGGSGVLPVAALIALAGIIGGAAWVRMRPAAQ